MSASKSYDPNPADETCRASWVRWRIVALLMALSFVSWFNRANIAAAYTERIQYQVDISEKEIGAVGTAFFLVYACFMTPGGWFSDRFGTRLSLGLMGIGLGVFAALTGGAGLLITQALPLLIALFLIRSTMGIFATPMYPAGSRAVAEWFPFSQRASANGLVQGAAPVGIALTPLLFGHLMDQVDWPRAFIITGAITWAVGLVWFLYARSSPAEHPGVNKEELLQIQSGVTAFQTGAERLYPRLEAGAWRRLLRNRSLVLLTISYAAIGYFEYLFFFWTQHYFKEVRHVDVETSRLYSLITNLSMAAGMILGGGLTAVLVRRFGARLGLVIVPIVGMLAGAVFLLIAIQAKEADGMVFWLCLANAAVGSTEAPQWTIAIELGGRHGATAAGIFNTGGNLGGALAPYGTPFIKDMFRGSWNASIIASSVILLLGLSLWLWIDPRERVPES
jgi:ACS family glucarate transporter-like MFS transporter